MEKNFSSELDTTTQPLTAAEAVAMCVAADMSTLDHYPTDAYAVLVREAEKLGTEPDKLISSAHIARILAQSAPEAVPINPVQ